MIPRKWHFLFTGVKFRKKWSFFFSHAVLSHLAFLCNVGSRFDNHKWKNLIKHRKNKLQIIHVSFLFHHVQHNLTWTSGKCVNQWVHQPVNIEQSLLLPLLLRLGKGLFCSLLIAGRGQMCPTTQTLAYSNGISTTKCPFLGSGGTKSERIMPELIQHSSPVVISIISTRLVTAGFRRYTLIKRTNGTTLRDEGFIWRTIKIRNFHKVKQPAGRGDRVINKGDQIWPQAWMRSLNVV